MILAYSVSLSSVDPIPGIMSLERDGLTCFFSPYDSPAEPAHVQKDALRFFNVNRDLFARVDLIAFRFPTLLQDEAELRQFIAAHAAQLSSELERLRGMAQVSVYFEPEQLSPAESGLDYMRAKAERAHALEEWKHDVRKAAGDLPTENLAQGERIHLLVPRENAENLLAKLRQNFQVAGPFPPSSFAKLLS